MRQLKLKEKPAEITLLQQFNTQIKLSETKRKQGNITSILGQLYLNYTKERQGLTLILDQELK